MRRVMWILMFCGGLWWCQNAQPVVAEGSPPLKATVLPLKSGEATLVETPGGLRTLVGAGAPGETEEVLGFLKRRGVRALDVLIVATWSERQAGGALSLLKRFPVKQLFHNPIFISNPRNDELIRYALARQEAGKLLVTQPTPGERITFFYSPPCQVRAAGPTGPMQAQFAGDPRCSLVLEFIYDRISLLFLGDTSTKHQQVLWRQADPQPEGQILMVGRNGGADTLLPALPRLAKTRVAVIPVSSGGQRPADATLQTLRKAGARIYRTDTQGTVSVSTDGREIRVTAQR